MKTTAFLVPLLFFILCTRIRAVSDLFKECTIVSCAQERDTRCGSSILAYCPTGAELDIIEWEFDCNRATVTVSLFPTIPEDSLLADQNTSMFGLVETFQSSVRPKVGLRVVRGRVLGPTALPDTYATADRQTDQFFTCNGEAVSIALYNSSGAEIEPTLEGPNRRIGNLVVETCEDKADLCGDGDFCNTCNANKDVAEVTGYGLVTSKRRLDPIEVKRTLKGTQCPIRDNLFYQGDFVYSFNARFGGTDLLGAAELNAETLFDCDAPSSSGAPTTKPPSTNATTTAVSGSTTTSTVASGAGTDPPTTTAGSGSTTSSSVTTGTTSAGSPSPESTPTPSSDSSTDDVCLDVTWLRAIGVRDEDMLHKEHIVSDVLCPKNGMPCGTRDHLVLYKNSLVSFADLCKVQGGCVGKRAAVNHAGHRFLLSADIHFDDVTVTACTGALNSFQRWVEEKLVRHVYVAGRYLRSQ